MGAEQSLYLVAQPYVPGAGPVQKSSSLLDRNLNRFCEDFEGASRVGRHGSIARSLQNAAHELPLLEDKVINAALLFAFNFIEQPGAGEGPIIFHRGK